ncbi:PepSY-like domain-containing protein [Puia sp.]|jgi:hypothetical protein|uniref:PepSY-like domain-containing protein n=1 Tax=Puia sp. TaxID=2045100 RepID=UPI002F41BAFF
MKKLIILIAIVLFTEPMIAQAATTQAATNHAAPAQPAAPHAGSVVVPPAVLTAFTTRFPNAQLHDWQQRPEGYIAGFKQNGRKLFAYYTADGTWKGTETPIKWTKNLPAAVREGWKNSSYGAWYVEDIKKIDQPDGPLYALHIDNGSTLDSDHADAFREEYVIFFNETGQLVRKDRK